MAVILQFTAPKGIIEVIDHYVYTKRLWSSRTQLIQVSVYQYLLRELKKLDQKENKSETVIIEDKTAVTVSIPNHDGTRKTYRIVKK